MHVAFVEPSFPVNQRRFVLGLKKVGARVTGIGEIPAEGLHPELQAALDDYVRVPSVVHEPALHQAVRALQERGPVDRLEATVEAHILPVAHVREACGIPGTTSRTAFLCRDKPAMKEVLREAGIPCARSTGASRPEEVRAFAGEVGFPLILKPRDAAGAAGTYKAVDEASLEEAIRDCGLDRGAPAAVEEFIEGHEGFFDTLSIEGQPVYEFICHYYPNVLPAMRNRWPAPRIVMTNRNDAPGYTEVRELCQRVLQALGIWTSPTHMEWFYGPKGLRFSEIGCRPPGVCVWDLYCAGNEFDLYEEWARAVCYGTVEARPSRRFAAGMVSIRPDRDGIVAGYEGVEEIEREFGEWLIDYHLPPPGTRTQPIEGGYMANGWVRMRHPDYDVLCGLLEEVGRRLRLYAR